MKHPNSLPWIRSCEVRSRWERRWLAAPVVCLYCAPLVGFWGENKLSALQTVPCLVLLHVIKNLQVQGFLKGGFSLPGSSWLLFPISPTKELTLCPLKEKSFWLEIVVYDQIIWKTRNFGTKAIRPSAQQKEQVADEHFRFDFLNCFHDIHSFRVVYFHCKHFHLMINKPLIFVKG